MKPLLFLLLCCIAGFVHSQERNLILVTIDGLRWQEVFQGADENLMKHEDFVRHREALAEQFGQTSVQQRREALLPFMWQTIAKQGAMMGDRDKGSKMSVTNPWYFSYPGYSEILTGYVDESINSNDKRPNPNVTFLEWLNERPGYQHKLAAFGGWDVFPYIYNTQRSQLHVNAGFMPAEGYPMSHQAFLLNQLQQEIPSPWHNVRLDAFTYRFAKDYLLAVKPRVMAIHFGETDDFAHDGHYDAYLHSAHQTDAFLADLWKTLQQDPFYRHNTNLIITTDHGRGGQAKDWQHHASRRAMEGYMSDLSQFENGIEGSNHIWLAAIGPDIQPRGLITQSEEFWQSQIAATALMLLGEPVKQFNSKAAPPIEALHHEK